MKLNLSQIPGAFHLPRPNWDVIRGWLEEQIPEVEREQAWEDAISQWLDTLNQALGDAYRTLSSGRLVVFAPTCYAHADALLQSADYSLATIMELLGDLASENWRGPLVLLLFEDPEAYYTYLALFYPEGEWGGSSGVCIKREGQVHIALLPGHAVQLVANHEITHACLCHLPLPEWLEEGITQHAEVVQGEHARDIRPEDAEEAPEHWKKHGLQAFWWGNGFHQADKGQTHSYLLARVLFHLLSVDHRHQFADFLRAAHSHDAGESAARAHLGKGLAALAAQFLGPGNWEPVPPNAAAFCRRATLFSSQGKLEQTIADCDEAIRLEPHYAEPYSVRGWARQALGQDALALADLTRAVELNEEDSDAHNNLAWLLATCPDEQCRDGERAIEHANRACGLTGFDTWYCLGTLAAACAEAGEFEEAIHWAKESLRRAPESEKTRCKDRLRLYKQARPFRETPGSRG